MSYLSKIRIAAVVLAAGAVGGGFAASAAHAEGAGNVPAAKAQPTVAAVAAAPLDDPRFAVVAQAGTLVRGRNAISTTHLSTGHYEVIFDRDMRGCAYVGTTGDTGSGNPLFGQLTVATRATNSNAVFVQTRATDGTNADRPFHLVVVC